MKSTLDHKTCNTCGPDAIQPDGSRQREIGLPKILTICMVSFHFYNEYRGHGFVEINLIFFSLIDNFLVLCQFQSK